MPQTWRRGSRQRVYVSGEISEQPTDLGRKALNISVNMAQPHSYFIMIRLQDF